MTKDKMEWMTPYRSRIDELDDKIIKLLAERADIIREVGHAKAKRGASPVVPHRVIEVYERNAKHAQEIGLDPDFIRELYSKIIDYAHILETDIITNHDR